MGLSENVIVDMIHIQAVSGTISFTYTTDGTNTSPIGALGFIIATDGALKIRLRSGVTHEFPSGTFNTGEFIPIAFDRIQAVTGSADWYACFDRKVNRVG